MPFTYPTNFELSEIQADLMAQGREGRIWLDLMPPIMKNAGSVRWTQMDNYFGLQHLRGADGQPSRVQRLGQKIYNYEPGVFGEFEVITETELLNRAGSVATSVPIPIDDLVIAGQTQLINREYDRMEASISTLLSTGTLSIKIDGPNGLQTGYSDTYTTQTFTAAVPWATVATATPIQNFQAVQQLGVGISVDLGAGAVAIMNSVTSNRLLNNTNAADFGGKRSNYGATLNNLTNINQYLLAQNLPQIQVDDRGYYPKYGQSGGVSAGFTKFIADGKVVVIGKRPGNAKVGEYQMTRNISNPNGTPGPYMFIKDYIQGVNAEKRVPGSIEIHRGHNGGPAIYYPSAVVIMSV